MVNRWMRGLLLAGTAAAAVATGLSQQAAAQTQMPGFFGGVAGWYILDSGNDALNFKNLFKNGGGVSPDNGWGGRVFMGYRFSNNWDVAVGGQGSWLGRERHNLDFGPPSGLFESIKAHYWAVDGESATQ